MTFMEYKATRAS